MSIDGKQNGTLLIVDDESSLSELLAEYSSTLIDNVITAGDGSSALELFKKTEKIDVILSDIKMPNMDGITFMEEVLKIDPSIIIIFMSGYPDKKTMSKALKLGAYDFLEKPFTLDQLGLILNRAFELKHYKTRMSELLQLIVFEYMDDLPYDDFAKLNKAEQTNILAKLSDVLRVKHANKFNKKAK